MFLKSPIGLGLGLGLGFRVRVSNKEVTKYVCMYVLPSDLSFLGINETIPLLCIIASLPICSLLFRQLTRKGEIYPRTLYKTAQEGCPFQANSQIHFLCALRGVSCKKKAGVFLWSITPRNSLENM